MGMSQNRGRDGSKRRRGGLRRGARRRALEDEEKR
jgi:hypothetical protein